MERSVDKNDKYSREKKKGKKIRYNSVTAEKKVVEICPYRKKFNYIRNSVQSNLCCILLLSHLNKYPGQMVLTDWQIDPNLC